MTRYCPFCKTDHPETEAFYRRMRKGAFTRNCHAHRAHVTKIRHDHRAGVRKRIPRPVERDGLVVLAQSRAWGGYGVNFSGDGNG